MVQQTIADQMDITQGAVSQYLKGDIPLNYHALRIFATALEVKPEDIRDDLPEQQHSSSVAANDPEWDDIPAFSQVASLGSGAEAQEYAESHKLKFKISSLRRKGLLGHKLAVFYGHGDSMLPRIKTGDAILFDESDTKDADDTIFVILWRGEVYAKKAEVIEGVTYFRSTNPDGDHNWRKPKRKDSPKEPIKILGRVRWIGSWED